MKKYRVLVVDDSAFMRKVISDLIAEHPLFEVAAVARNGKEAVDKTIRLSPDVVTMDVEMPEMNGLAALKAIMREKPTPVVMLSSLTREGAKETIQALEWGAVDFLQKPSGSISLDIHKVKRELHDKLETAVHSKNLKPIPAADERERSVRPTAAAGSAAAPAETRPTPPNPREVRRLFGAKPVRSIVAIGTSTGGPRALLHVISRLPADFPAPVLVVQHMPPRFTRSLAQRLDQASTLTVVEASDGQPVEEGTVYIAPGGCHLKLRKRGEQTYALHVTDREPPVSGHRPSVDVLFESLVPHVELTRHAVLLTGMGSDGAKGMLALKRSGAATTIAESEETCVVYGMPRAAVELNGVDAIVPLYAIADKLVAAVMGSRPVGIRNTERF